jgi:putative nucleotidyltransferase with HDIG domain
VTSIDHAARLLGAAQLMQIAMASHTRALLAPPQEGYGLAPGALWTNAVAVALSAGALGQRLQVPDRGLLFTAGLLHDVGKIILNEFVAQKYAAIARRVAAERVSFCEAERAVLGYTHAELGGLVAERWGLPAEIVRCVRFHHEPGALPEPDRLVDVVHVADAICILMGVGGGDDGQMYRVDSQAMTRLGLHEKDLESIGVMTVVELKAIQSAFGAVQGAAHVSDDSRG